MIIDCLIVTLVQLLISVLYKLFMDRNIKHLDMGPFIALYIVNLIPLIGFLIDMTLILYILIYGDDYDLSDTKINRFLFKSYFEDYDL